SRPRVARVTNSPARGEPCPSCSAVHTRPGPPVTCATRRRRSWDLVRAALYSAEVSAAYESRARATATAATAPMAGPRVSMPAPLQAPEMVWASNQAWSRIKQVTSTPLTTETPRWSRTAPATGAGRGSGVFIRDGPRVRRCPCLVVCAARNIPGPRFSCSGSVLLRFPGDGRARDALAEHPVAPRLVTQHQRQEGHGDPRHHGERVV